MINWMISYRFFSGAPLSSPNYSWALAAPRQVVRFSRISSTRWSLSVTSSVCARASMKHRCPGDLIVMVKHFHMLKYDVDLDMCVYLFVSLSICLFICLFNYSFDYCLVIYSYAERCSTMNVSWRLMMNGDLNWPKKMSQQRGGCSRKFANLWTTWDYQSSQLWAVWSPQMS